MNTGRSVRVAVIDSGVHASHPHIGGVAGGVTIGTTSNEETFVDTIGHGTAVMAAIKEKAPDAEYFAVRVFYSSLRTSVDLILRGIEWCIANRIDVINLSLGTINPEHRARFAALIGTTTETGPILVAARNANGSPALPGCMPGVIGVELDWDCPRDTWYCNLTPDGLAVSASGYPRPVPGVPPAKNLHGISFAVANATGFVVQECESLKLRSYSNICAALTAHARTP